MASTTGSLDDLRDHLDCKTEIFLKAGIRRQQKYGNSVIRVNNSSKENVFVYLDARKT